MNGRISCRGLLITLMLLGLAQAQDLSLADRAAAAALQSVSGLPHAVVLRRIAADGRQDLVVALASAQTYAGNPRWCWWNTKDRLGLFLQDRNSPDQVHTLAIESGPNDDCATRIERFTTEELVLSCVGEKWSTYDNQKFTYDVGTRKLLSHFSYPPFSNTRAVQGRSGPQFVMSDTHQLLLVEIDPATHELRVSPGAQIPEAMPDAAAGFGAGGRFRLTTQKNRYGSEFPVVMEGEQAYLLPQTDLSTWQRGRTDDAERNEQTGPHQMEGQRLWFGKTFYNSEGLTGLGGFGYFDTDTAQYRIFSPPEIYVWSVSAILVEPDSVWLALYRRGEYGNSPGGLLRWDRRAAQVQHWDLPSVAVSILRAGETMYLGTTNGLISLRGDRVATYFVDRSAAGHYQIVRGD